MFICFVLYILNGMNGSHPAKALNKTTLSNTFYFPRIVRQMQQVDQTCVKHNINRFIQIYAVFIDWNVREYSGMDVSFCGGALCQ